MGVHTGNLVTCQQALNSKEDTIPKVLAWDSSVPPVAMLEVPQLSPNVFARLTLLRRGRWSAAFKHNERINVWYASYLIEISARRSRAACLRCRGAPLQLMVPLLHSSKSAEAE